MEQLANELKTAENLDCFKSLLCSVQLKVNDLNELLYGRERTFNLKFTYGTIIMSLDHLIVYMPFYLYILF